MNIRLISLLLITSPATVLADWTLDNEASSLTYVTTKANAAAEINHFEYLSGSIDDAGAALLEIDLNSVNTLVDIRDERMREVLFETGTYPTAIARMKVDMSAVSSLGVGNATTISGEAMLSLRDAEVSLTASLLVVRLAENRLLVSTNRPLIVNASQVGLLAGIEKLRELAGLPSISPAVPVTLSLVFEKT